MWVPLWTFIRAYAETMRTHRVVLGLDPSGPDCKGTRWDKARPQGTRWDKRAVSAPECK